MKFFLKKASAVLLCVLTLAGMAVFSNGAAATETDTDIIEVSITALNTVCIFLITPFLICVG